MRPTCINWLQNNGILAKGMLCKCGTVMRLGDFAGISEGRRWRCPSKHCKKFASLELDHFANFFISKKEFGLGGAYNYGLEEFSARPMR